MADPGGLIFDVQGFSIHDGPGCRTAVFLKGCTLRCSWCSNPEGISPYPQILYRDSRCIKCYECRDACKNRAIAVEATGAPIGIDESRCRECADFPCVRACHYGALEVCGNTVTVEDLMKKLQRDRQYWGPGGGVTLSGGEPMVQYRFTRSLLQRCYRSYIHTGMETCGYAPWEDYEGVLDYLDWIFFDLKHMDPDIHRSATGVSNRFILQNAVKIAERENLRVIFRMPVIPGFNDSPENIEATARFLERHRQKEINILPLHHLGSSKYRLLRLKYGGQDLAVPSPERMREIGDIFSRYSIACYIDSATPF